MFFQRHQTIIETSQLNALIQIWKDNFRNSEMYVVKLSSSQGVLSGNYYHYCLTNQQMSLTMLDMKTLNEHGQGNPQP